jgi:hypothetical protein
MRERQANTHVLDAAALACERAVAAPVSLCVGDGNNHIWLRLRL